MTNINKYNVSMIAAISAIVASVVLLPTSNADAHEVGTQRVEWSEGVCGLGELENVAHLAVLPVGRIEELNLRGIPASCRDQNN